MLGLSKIVTMLSRGGFLMWVLFIASIAAGAVIIERFVFFMRLRKFNNGLIIQNIFDALAKKDVNKALKICEDNSYCITRIIKAALLRINSPKEVLKESIDNAAINEVASLEKNMYFLSTLSHVTPLIGLLGTVLGMVKSFYSIEQKSASGVIQPSDIAGGIWEALLTTVAGLSVAIICYLAYSYFSHYIRLYIRESEQASSNLLEIVFEWQKEKK